MSKLIEIADRNDARKRYKVITCLVEDRLDLTVLDGENVYSSQVEIEDVYEFANSFETTVDHYMKALHQLLSETSTVTISVIKNELSVYKNENIKYFVKKIDQCNYSTKLESVLVDVFKEKSNLELKVNKLGEEKRNMINECTSLKILLEEKVNEHANHEKKLLNSFTQLLNEKKRRIQYLLDLLESQIINTIPTKRVKLDLSDEENSIVETPNKNDISDDENEALLDDNDNSKLSNDQNEKLSNFEDDDEDSLLRSPVDSPGGGDFGRISLPKRVSAGSSAGVSFRDDAKEVKKTKDVESQSVESVISTEARFTSQDIADRLFN